MVAQALNSYLVPSLLPHSSSLTTNHCHLFQLAPQCRPLLESFHLLVPQMQIWLCTSGPQVDEAVVAAVGEVQHYVEVLEVP